MLEYKKSMNELVLIFSLSRNLFGPWRVHFIMFFFVALIKGGSVRCFFGKADTPKKSAPAAGFWNSMYVNRIKLQ